jgi:GNAT superfamily N-acetyltransferase
VQLTDESLRDAYDQQLRAWVPPRPPAGWIIERDGPLTRIAADGQEGFVTYVTLDVDGPELDALIARQRDYFAARGEAVEWKLHGHDRPADLPQRLIAAGFVPDDQETVVIGEAAPLANRTPPLPAGVRLREVTARADLDRIVVMEETVWGEDRSHLAVALEDELAADPGGMTVVVVEAGELVASRPANRPCERDDPRPSGPVVCAGWIRYVGGTSFGTLWGGSTLPEWRGQGIYRAVVAYRAALAIERGHTLLEVDASDDSRPILQRSGFVAVTTTTPYVHPAPGD